MTQTSSLTRSAPESQGIPSSAIGDFVDAVEQSVDSMHSFMLLRHGQVVAEGWWDPYAPQYPHMLYSLSKSFTSTAIGMLVAEGKVSVDDPVLSFFPEEAPAERSANLRAMRVRHLLTMTTGHAEDTLEALHGDATGRWRHAFLAQPVEYEPGTHFLYNTGATYMLSAIVQRLTGLRLLEFLQPRLFAPLGIKHPAWEVSPEGINTGGYGLSITTADIARFGQLYLQKGVWQGTRILPEAWVEAATKRQVANAPNENPDWEQGYGYQFWQCRHGCYRGDGAFGQYCIVMPAQHAVLAITSGVSDMQHVLDLVWQHLLPAMQATPLADDQPAQSALTSRLAALRLPPVQGQRTSPVAADVSGKVFAMAENPTGIEQAGLDFGEGCALTLQDGRGRHQISCGYGEWVRGTADLATPDLHGSGSAEQIKVAASGAWTSEDTYEAKIWLYETPFAHSFVCHFAGDRVIVEQRVNVSFGPTEEARLAGQMV